MVSDGDQLVIETRPAPGGRTVVVRGELDLATAGILKTKLRQLQQSTTDRLVLDLRELTFMDSAGLHSLLAVERQAGNGDRRMKVICAAGGQVARLLALTGVDRHLDLTRDPVRPTDGVIKQLPARDRPLPRAG